MSWNFKYYFGFRGMSGYLGCVCACGGGGVPQTILFGDERGYTVDSGV